MGRLRSLSEELGLLRVSLSSDSMYWTDKVVAVVVVLILVSEKLAVLHAIQEYVLYLIVGAACR